MRGWLRLADGRRVTYSDTGPRDGVRYMADALGIERSAVVGVSAGGPYALAVARELGARVSRVALCSSLSPLCAPHRTPGMGRRIRLPLAPAVAARRRAISGQRELPRWRRRGVRGMIE